MEEVEEDSEVDNPDGDQNPTLEIAGSIEVFNPLQTDKGYLLVNDPGSNLVFLMNKEGAEILHEWDLFGKLGNNTELSFRVDLVRMHSIQ